MTTSGVPLELIAFTKRYGGIAAVDSIDLKVPAGTYNSRQLETIATLYDSEDQLEGARAFAEKRDPVWKGR